MEYKELRHFLHRLVANELDNGDGRKRIRVFSLVYHHESEQIMMLLNDEIAMFSMNEAKEIPSTD